LQEAVTTLHNIFEKPTNNMFARYLLSTCKQQCVQSIDEYLLVLKRLCKDGNYTTEQHKQQAIRDAFVTGVYLPSV